MRGSGICISEARPFVMCNFQAPHVRGVEHSLTEGQRDSAILVALTATRFCLAIRQLFLSLSRRVKRDPEHDMPSRMVSILRLDEPYKAAGRSQSDPVSRARLINANVQNFDHRPGMLNLSNLLIDIGDNAEK